MIRPDDLLSIGVNNLIKRKLRTFLTLLGVTIGTAAIIVLVSLSNGMEESFKKNIVEMGGLSTITIEQPYDGGGVRKSTKVKLDPKTVRELESMEHVEAVLPIKSLSANVVLGKKVFSSGVNGTDLSKLKAFGVDLYSGQPLTNSADGVFFGFSADQDFYDQRQGYMGGPMPDASANPNEYKPLVELQNKKIVITADYDYPYRQRMSTEDSKVPKKYKTKGVGILTKTDNWMVDHGAFASVAFVKKIIKDNAKYMGDKDTMRRLEFYDRAYMKVDSMENVAGTQAKLKEMGFEPRSPMDIINATQKTNMIMKAILGGIGGVSLLVAAIGIANTMVMSIYERTREIGVMKVIGAELEDIRNIFLVESGLIGLTGGILGVLLSVAISSLLNQFAGQALGGQMGVGGGSALSIIDFRLVLFGIAFATMIGILSGYAPAKRAMKLSVLNALRNNA